MFILALEFTPLVVKVKNVLINGSIYVSRGNLPNFFSACKLKLVTQGYLKAIRLMAERMGVL